MAAAAEEEEEASAEGAVVDISEEAVEAWTKGSEEEGASEAEEDSTMDPT